MTEPWKYTTFLECVDHWQTLITGILALCAAILAVFVTIRIENWKARKEEKAALLKEIRVTNTITMVVFGITNTVLASKKQQIVPLKTKFDQDKLAVQQALHDQQTGRGGEVVFRADFRSLPPLTLPLTLVQSQILEHITLDKRPIVLMTTLTEAFNSLNVSVTKRNQLIEVFKVTALPPPQLTALYFGFPYAQGQINQEYADSMAAIYDQTDDIIFFSIQLGKELSDHGEQLAALFRKRFGKKVPNIAKPDFSKSADLLPNEKKYADWFNMFVRREESRRDWLGRVRG